MSSQEKVGLQNFFVAGINYRKSEAAIRGKYAVSRENCIQLFSKAPEFSLHSFFILSTCNRTEIYGFAEDPARLIRLLCSATEGSLEDFQQIAYVKNGRIAVEHLFEVAAGLDSQILGDYEIVGQIRQAAKLAKENGYVDTRLERMINGALQASKEVKTATGLSGGTVSVSFAAIQCIKSLIDSPADKSVLLVGTGKIGRSTTRNLIDYIGVKNITLINRTIEKAQKLASELQTRFATLDELNREVRDADIILTATSATEPVIRASALRNGGPKLIIDLSIPHNVEPAVASLPGIRLINVDDLSQQKDETLLKRQEEIPAALAIIGRHTDEFFEWLELRKHAPVLKAVKTKLRELGASRMYIDYSSHFSGSNKGKDNIQRVINGMAVKMRSEYRQGCHYIEAMHEYIVAAAK